TIDYASNEKCARSGRAVTSQRITPIPFVQMCLVLILTGEWDPVTPPSNGDAVAKGLKNSLHIVVPHGAHGLGGLENIDCILGITAAFVERGTLNGLDTACVKTIRRRGFALKFQ